MAQVAFAEYHQAMATQNITFLGQSRSLGPLAALLIYLTGVTGEILLLSSIYLVMPVGRLSLRHSREILAGCITSTFGFRFSVHTTI